MKNVLQMCSGPDQYSVVSNWVSIVFLSLMQTFLQLQAFVMTIINISLTKINMPNKF